MFAKCSAWNTFFRPWSSEPPEALKFCLCTWRSHACFWHSRLSLGTRVVKSLDYE